MGLHKETTDRNVGAANPAPSRGAAGSGPSPSRTAIFVAENRAAHQLLDGEPKILLDPVSAKLLPRASAAALRADEPRLQQTSVRRSRANKVLRSRYAEDRLEAAARRGVTQYVVLGAGLDTFAYRQPSWASRVTIVEVDHPASQDFKMVSLKAAGVDVPTNVKFMPIDFSSEAVGDRLASGLLDPAQPIFVSWLGVTQYLTRDAIAATLGAVGSWKAGSEIVLSYIMDDWSSLETVDKQALQRTLARWAATSEPWLSRFSARAIGDMLSAAGFSRIDHFTIEDAIERYFRDRADNLLPEHGTGLVHASARHNVE